MWIKQALSGTKLTEENVGAESMWTQEVPLGYFRVENSQSPKEKL